MISEMGEFLLSKAIRVHVTIIYTHAQWKIVIERPSSRQIKTKIVNVIVFNTTQGNVNSYLQWHPTCTQTLRNSHAFRSTNWEKGTWNFKNKLSTPSETAKEILLLLRQFWCKVLHWILFIRVQCKLTGVAYIPAPAVNQYNYDSRCLTELLLV